MFNIKLATMKFEDFQPTMNVSGATEANLGQAVTIDATANNTVKPTGDGDPIFGVLDTFEDRSDSEGIVVGAVSTKVIQLLEYTGTAPAPGDGIVGSATAGKVKGTGAAALGGQAIATAVYTADGTVEVYVR